MSEKDIKKNGFSSEGAAAASAGEEEPCTDETIMVDNMR